MEPTQGPLAFKLYTKVESVNEVVEKEYVSGSGADAVFNNVSRGWFVAFEGSHESLFLGMEKPGLVVGDEVEVNIRKKAHGTIPQEASSN